MRLDTALELGISMKLGKHMVLGFDWTCSSFFSKSVLGFRIRLDLKLGLGMSMGLEVKKYLVCHFPSSFIFKKN